MKKTAIVFASAVCILFLTCCYAGIEGDDVLAEPADTGLAPYGQDTALAVYSEIKCPECGYRKAEKVPTEICRIKYTCDSCRSELRPMPDDCCVFCSYGTHKCPSKTEEHSGD
jgi:hypothetical protein